MKKEMVHEKSLVQCQFDTVVMAQHSDAPQFLVQPRSQNVNEGQNVKFTCEIAGEPSPEVEWLKDNMIVSSFSRKSFIYNKKMLHLQWTILKVT